jgi:hypothetical protein
MRDDDDLAPLLEELASTLGELRDQLDDEQPRRLRDLLRFTEQYTIPAVVSLLETNIRLLELTAGAIRLADGRLDDRARDGRGRGAVAVDTLDRALDDLGGALRGEPTDPDARALLEEARSLRREVRSQLAAEGDPEPSEQSTRDGTDGEPRSYTVPVRPEGDDARPARSARTDADASVDVDAELETIRREVHGAAAGDEDEGTNEAEDGDEAGAGGESPHSGEN